MAINWNEIAAEVHAAIRDEIASRVQVEKKTYSGPKNDPTVATTYHWFWSLRETSRVRDRDGTLTGQTFLTLTLSNDGAGAAPSKKDRVQVDDRWYEIVEVRPLAPGGIPVLWDCDVLL